MQLSINRNYSTQQKIHFGNNAEPPKQNTVTIIGSLRSSPEQYDRKIIPLYEAQGLSKEALQTIKSHYVCDDITPYVEMAGNIAEKIVKKGGHVLTGGGPGIMEAANSAARKINPSNSWGIATEQYRKYNIDAISNLLTVAKFPAERSELFNRKSDYIVALPGGYGTLEEIFVSAEKISDNDKYQPKKILLVGKKFYEPLMAFLKNAEKIKLAKNVDKTFKLVDTEDEVMKELDFKA